MSSDPFTRKTNEYYRRIESTADLEEKIQICEELENYISGFLDSMEDSPRQGFGHLYIMILSVWRQLLQNISNSSLRQDNLEKRLEQIEIELDIKRKHK